MTSKVAGLCRPATFLVYRNQRPLCIIVNVQPAELPGSATLKVRMVIGSIANLIAAPGLTK
jgi:hypothetical protein